MMRTMKCFLIGMLILVGSYASAITAKERTLVGNYFLQKSLVADDIRSILARNDDGNLKPVFIYQKANANRTLDGDKTFVHVENLDITNEGDKTKVVLVYHIDNHIEVTHTFISDDNKNWKAEDATIHIFNSKEI